jgi:hypothetical protein
LGTQGHGLIEDVNARIDRVIQENGAQLRELRRVLFVMFFAGLAVLLYGIVKTDRYLIALSMGVNGLTCWPIIRLERLYRRTIALAAIPQITALLSTRDANRELCALIRRLLE